MLQADAGIRRILRRQFRPVRARGVNCQQLFHLIGGGHPRQGRMGGVHQLPHRAEEAEGQHQHHQPVGKRDLSREKLPGGNGRGGRHRAVNQPVGKQEGGKIHPHHIHDLIVEVPGFFRQHLLPPFVTAKKLKGGEPLDALQVITGQIFHGGPVFRFQLFNMTAENIVDRQQQDRNGKKQYRRDEGNLPQPKKQIDRGDQAV